MKQKTMTTILVVAVALCIISIVLLLATYLQQRQEFHQGEEERILVNEGEPTAQVSIKIIVPKNTTQTSNTTDEPVGEPS